MERRRLVLWVQLPLVLLWTLAFLIGEQGSQARLSLRVLHGSVYPSLRRLEGFYTDLKFRLRGVRPVKQKIVVVEVDDRAVSAVGRWPWHRDFVAGTVQQVLDAGAKVVGLDMVFPEADERVPEDLVELLKEHQLGDEAPKFETDLALRRIIDVGKDRLVLGWMSDTWCRPDLVDERACPVTDPKALTALPADFGKFGIADFHPPATFDPGEAPIVSAPSIVGNLPMYDAAAAHAGFLVAGVEDPDDVVRRAQLVMLVAGRPHPSLPLEMLRVGTDDELALALDEQGRVARLALQRAARALPVDRGGALVINFRGPGYHFPFVSALDVLGEADELPYQQDGKILTASREALFKDAYVLVGVTSMGARDLRHFPFGRSIPGTEGLATVLDNLLSDDALARSRGALGGALLLGLLTVGAVLFGLAMIRLDALPAMLLAILVIGSLAVIDVAWVFARRGVDLNSIYLVGELLSLFVATVAVKYALEERGKRFIHSTFSKYLAPAVVDQMLGDPTKMQLGGETRKLTIMMSDLRGFTAMAERMKPAEVLSVLNHYLGAMADIIVEHNGTIDEFIGDAILVIFGAPIAGPDDAQRAVACAIAMQGAMTGINERNAALGLPKLEMGIALNTGEVIVGNIGSTKHVKYGVVGSHVNLTARIESNTVGGQILVSGTTLTEAGPDVQVGEQQLIVAKGFPQPIPAFDVRGIGGKWARTVPEVDLALVDLAQPIEVRYRIMLSKNEEGEARAGALRKVSPLGAILETAEPLEAFKNLKLQVLGPDGPVDGDLYAKVLASGTTSRLRFTAVPPAVARFIEQRTGA